MKKKNNYKLIINKTFLTVFAAIMIIGAACTLISHIISFELLFTIGLLLLFFGVAFIFITRPIEMKIVEIIEKRIEGKVKKKESGQLTLDENSEERGGLSLNEQQNGELSDLTIEEVEVSGEENKKELDTD